MIHDRSSGILLHVTSLPGPYGIGDLGPNAYTFVDSLIRAKQKLWQVLPLVPVGHGFSPYSSPSTFAGNPLVISPDLLIEDGLLSRDDVADVDAFPNDHVDFARVIPAKRRILRRAYERSRTSGQSLAGRYEEFCRHEMSWLDDYALFMAIKEAQNESTWTEWPAELRDREPEAIDQMRVELADEIAMHRFWQFLFADQWGRLRAYCNKHGIRVVGDIPIYVAHDSADVWAHPHLFRLDEGGFPTVVAGVPPDYFSETGQRWGNPIYRWDLMRRSDYEWWTQRMRSIFKQVDIVRLDHFRAFEAFWEVPASEPTAVNGQWREGPGADFFRVLKRRLGSLPVIAEDLGLITPEVVALMQEFGFPGMAVFQFAFDSDPSDKFLPHNYRRNLVAYTGTHDNDTLHGWFTANNSTQDEAQVARARAFCRRYLNIVPGGEADLHWRFIRALLMSVANTTIVPLQDLLGLGREARMNIPGKESGNWAWRYEPDGQSQKALSELAELTTIYGRA